MGRWGERQGYRLADELRRRTWLHIGFRDRPGVALVVCHRNKLVLAALAHGAKETRFGITGEVIALQRGHDKSEVEVNADDGHHERNKHGS
jgi:hypothetical protein